MLTSTFTLTLLFLTLSLSANASHRRHHSNILIKKRSPFPQDGGFPPIIGAAAGPSSGTLASQTAKSATSASSTNIVAISTSISVPSPSSTPASSSSVTVTPSSASSQSTSSTLSTSTTVSTAAAATSTLPPIVPLPSTTFNLPSETQVSITTTALSAASPTSSAAPSSDSSKHTTLTVIIIIAAAVGGVAIIWTAIRKWKFRPSSQFEDRMQPIDWEPTNPEEGIIPGHRRIGSNTSSFLSGPDHEQAENTAGRGVGANYGATSDIAPIPEHDFTAGPANLAPVGGYADLARGSSPQPPMQESLHRGPSIARQQYDQYQTYSQDAYDYNTRGGY